MKAFAYVTLLAIVWICLFSFAAVLVRLAFYVWGY